MRLHLRVCAHDFTFSHHPASTQGYWAVQVKSPEAAVKEVEPKGGIAYVRRDKLKIPSQYAWLPHASLKCNSFAFRYYIEMKFMEEVLMVTKALEATGLPGIDNDMMKLRDATHRAALLCFPALASVPGPRIAHGGYIVERKKFISDAQSQRPHVATFLTRLWKQADDGVAFDWAQLVMGFWGDLDSAMKAHVVAIFELAQNFRMRDEAELIVCVHHSLPEVKKCNNFSRYEMRASRAIERAAFIVHESLRSCSKPLRRGSMHDERQNFLSDMQAIDPNLADSVSNVYAPACILRPQLKKCNIWQGTT